MKILIICSGNICRSPMVAACMRERLARSGMSHVVVDSAGTLGIDDIPASAEAIEVMREIGVDLGGHRSRGLTANDLRTSDIVLAMGRAQLEHLALHDPNGGGRRFLLRAFENGPRPLPDPPDLADPIGQPVAVFRDRRDTIRVCVDHFVLALERGEAGP